MELQPDREPRFFRPDGRPLSEAPAPPALPMDPIAALEEAHREEGLPIDAGTGLPLWRGESWDVAWAVDAFRSIGKARAERFRGNASVAPD